ncbi:MAG: VWA domain-containing protein [Pyrinomonadaceae bacterium]|nr:VWA domain-containing protein [Pyrinomonadaceae bacterium]
MRKVFLSLVIFVLAGISGLSQVRPQSQGMLVAFGSAGELGACPLKHTEVKVEISGFLSRVRVKQEFQNDFDQPIEAVYTFPLSQNSAVDDMTMTIGSRVIKGKIMLKEEARKVYENARSSGQTAALLDQERTNVFTQSVANILPGEKIVVEISYVETLKYEDGKYEFVFPMTVGPRYSPASVSLADSAKVSPPIAATRTGHDISIEVMLDAGVPIESIKSPLHEIESTNFSASSALVKLKNENSIPNKDFILRYDVTGKRIEDAILTHRSERGGFFTMILSPPEKFRIEDVVPKEIVFVLDTSGSMSGYPIEKAKEAMLLSLEGLHPNDMFNLITFAGDTHILFDNPVNATPANLSAAKEFLRSRAGGGGTEMMKAVKAALAPSGSKEHIRIVCFMTDGFVSNESQILSEIQKHPNARVFGFGIGNSVNRMLLDEMSKEGNGEVEYVTLVDESEKAARRFYERVRTPLLTDISIDWNGLPVSDVYPSRIGDLFSAKPVVLNGRYSRAAAGKIKLNGKVGGQLFVREIEVEFPETQSRNDVLATLWARKRIEQLTSKDYGSQTEEVSKPIEAEIAKIGLDFRLMTNFTSFVAVEERIVNRGGQMVTIDVPVEMADGVEMDQAFSRLEILNSLQSPSSGGGGGGGRSSGTGSGSGIGSGSGSGRGSGSGSGNGTSGTLNMSVSSVVEVTDSSSLIDMTKSSIDTVLTRELMDNMRGMSNSGGTYGRRSRSENQVNFELDIKEISDFRKNKLGEKTAADEIAASVANLPRPDVPKESEWKEGERVVKVEFAVNEKGEVYLAKATSGSEVLRRPSESAALKSKFSPIVFDGESLRMFGTASYKFVNSKKVEITIDKIRVEFPEALKRRVLLRHKVHFWVYDLIERLEKGSTETGVNDASFVVDGKASIRLVLNDGSPRTIARLKAAGMEISSVNGVKVDGKIKTGKIAELALLDEIKYVSP